MEIFEEKYFICSAGARPPYSAEVKNSWNYTSPPQYVFMV